MCGASASPEATRCEHCGARLATVACPSCFGMSFRGAKFCSHCGAALEREDLEGAQARPCPRCRTALRAAKLGSATVHDCPQCDGIWVDAPVLQQICADRDQQAAVLGAAQCLPEITATQIEKVQYRPCPLCKKLMNRVNFARCSQVVVDVCRNHGTWFDKDELRRIVEFLRSGGMEMARQAELAELERQRRKLQAAKVGEAWSSTQSFGGLDGSELGGGLRSAGALLNLFFR
jgi:Zn-finger nucleic acid-binding protein